MSAPTAADYGAALALLADLATGQPKRLTDRGLRVEDVTNAALAFVRARLVADEAYERYLETSRAGGYGDNPDALNDLDDECDRLDEATTDAYYALVALAANAGGAS